MIYTLEKAVLVTEQLRKFTDSNDYMVVGQFANIDFWIDEVVATLHAIDKHNIRFNKMYEAQENWIETYDVRVPDYCHICRGICELSEEHYKRPELPKKRANIEKKEIRKELVNAVYYFLIRCCNMELINKEEIKAYCDKVGTSIDPGDLKF
jgi:predicted patatin/cPLA2 family phospholipase